MPLTDTACRSAKPDSKPRKLPQRGRLIMATLDELTAFRRALQDARYSGVRRVRDATGEEIEYRSDSELAAALKSVETEIAYLSRSTPRTQLFRTSKGF